MFTTYSRKKCVLLSVSTFQSISSRARRKVFDVHNVFKEILELQKEYEMADTERNTTIKPRRVNLGFIQQPSISHSGISITVFDEPLVRLYHTVFLQKRLHLLLLLIMFFLFEICLVNSVRQSIRSISKMSPLN